MPTAPRLSRGADSGYSPDVRLGAPIGVSCLLALGCGGNTESDRGSAPPGNGGSGGTGALAGGGGAPGAGGSGTGGTRVDGGVVCPSLPDCNWCSGAPVSDAFGCVIGYSCENGQDPCLTRPCREQPCPAGQFCALDGLCWEPAAPCEQFCSAEESSCACQLACADNQFYQYLCAGLDTNRPSCDCFLNGVPQGECMDRQPGDVLSCEAGIECCFGP